MSAPDCSDPAWRTRRVQIKQLFVAALALGSACQSEGATPREVSHRNAGPHADVMSAETTPMQVHTVLWPKGLGRVDPCGLHLRAYRPGDSSGLPVWDSARQVGEGCGPARLWRSGDYHRFDSAAEILGDSLPPGLYRFGVTLALPSGDTLELPADSLGVTTDPRPPTTDLSALSYHARTQATGSWTDTLHVAVTAANRGDRRVSLTYGACMVRLLVYQDAKLSGQPAWDSERRSRPCLLFAKKVELGPGQAQEFHAAYAIHEILSDSLRSGRYRLAAMLRLNSDSVVVSAGTAELKVGFRERLFRWAGSIADQFE